MEVENTCDQPNTGYYTEAKTGDRCENQGVRRDARICSGPHDCEQHWQDLSLGPKHSLRDDVKQAV